MKLISTRDSQAVDALEAIICGIAKSGGLFVPTSFPELTKEEIEFCGKASYSEAAALVLSKYIDELSLEELNEITKRAYGGFDTEAIAPNVKLDENEYILELWHGRTLAFKDMALSVLPLLLVKSKEKKGLKEKTLVLVATSGDTGKAALDGFANVEGIDVCVFYPSDGVSQLQKLQMITQEGENTHVFAVKGNFDDAQTGVKNIFAHKEFVEFLRSKGYELSSANSINFGRLAPQIAYYVCSYARLLKEGEVKEGEKVNFVVPTGNFGNILAAYYAMKMGIPVNKLICASNKNNVLTDFFRKGKYTANREFFKTISPSMDILVSSNLERLLFELCGRKGEKVADWMKQLKEQGSYDISAEEMDLSDFYADWADEEETKQTIKKIYDKHGYLLDTHTAVAVNVYDKYLAETGDKTKTVIASTANPYKFVYDVLENFEKELPEEVFDAVDMLNKVTGEPIPQNIKALKGKEIRHKGIAEKTQMEDAILGFIK